MTQRIKFYKLNEFTRLRNEIGRRFGTRLVGSDRDQRLQARAEALEFLRTNGFDVDDRLEWITWSDPRDYTVALLKWS